MYTVSDHNTDPDGGCSSLSLGFLIMVRESPQWQRSPKKDRFKRNFLRNYPAYGNLKKQKKERKGSA